MIKYSLTVYEIDRLYRYYYHKAIPPEISHECAMLQLLQSFGWADMLRMVVGIRDHNNQVVSVMINETEVAG